MEAVINNNMLEQAEMAYWSKLYQKELHISAFRKNISGGIACAFPKIDILAFNRMVGLGLHKPTESKDIDEIINFYNKAGAKRFFVQVSPFAQPDDLSKMLLEKGFKYHNNWAKLAMTLDKSKLKFTDTELNIHRIELEKSLEFGSIITQSFGWHEELAPIFASSIGLPGYQHFFVNYKEKNIAAAALHIENEVASMAVAGTLPEFRGLGAQKLLLHHRLQIAYKMGCNLVVSETAEDSEERPVTSYRNMIKVGFELQYLRKNFLYEFK